MKMMGDAHESVRDRLLGAAAGLLYGSEIDAPFTWVHFPDAGEEALTPSGFARLIGADAAEVEERELGKAFARHIERVSPADPGSSALVPRYRALRDLLSSELGGVKGLRVGSVEIRVFFVGRLADGTVAGLETHALET
jgi:hypothetical protein